MSATLLLASFHTVTKACLPLVVSIVHSFILITDETSRDSQIIRVSLVNADAFFAARISAIFGLDLDSLKAEV